MSGLGVEQAVTSAALADLTPREHTELLRWLDDKAPYAGWQRDVADRPHLPVRADASSAVRAGALSRGQWRGVPSLSRAPADAVDCPRVSGRAWCVEAALASGDDKRIKAHKRAKRAAQRRARRAR